MPLAVSLSLSDRLALAHPLLMILFVYPVGAVTVRLATHVRERRLNLHPQPASVLVEHAEHGQWLTSGAVLAVLLALLWGLFLEGPRPPATGPAAGLLLVAAASLAACLALWRCQRLPLRLGFALLSLAGLLTLSAQPPIGPLPDPLLSSAFWTSHDGAGLLLCALLLCSTALRPAIGRRPALRRLHALAGGLVALLMVMQAISGCSDLLQMGRAG